jgi:WD40 repeat protein
LEKDPARRYYSAEDLAQDLERFLSNRPIEARPIGWWGRSVKWLRRHPTKATVAGVIVLAALTLLTMGGIYHLQLMKAVQVAKANAEESQENLIRLHVAQGTSAMNDGDGFTALLWFTEALRMDPGIVEHEDKHRQRIAAVQQALPEPLQLWVHEGAVNDTRISPDGKVVLTGGDEGKIHLWDSETGKETVPPLSMSGPVKMALFSPDGKRIVAASQDGTARIWDTASGKPLTPPLVPGGTLHAIDFSPDGRQLVTASGKTARVWDAETGKPFSGELPHNGEVNAAIFSPDGRFLATAGDDGLVRLWDSVERKPTPTVFSHGRAILCLAFSPDSKRIASGSTDFSAQVWDIAEGKPLGRRLRHHDRVTLVAFSPSGDRLLTSSEDNTAQIWRIADGESLVGPLRHKSVIRWATFSPDGCRVATAGDDNSARVWSANSGAPLTPPLRANGSYNHVAFSPDGRWLATASDDGTARLWNVVCRHEASVIDEAAVFRHRVDRQLGVGSLDIRRTGTTPSRTSPDGRLVLKINKDNTARVYDAKSGEPLTPPLAHHGEIAYVAFNSDGERIVTASMDQTARVWDAQSGAPVSPPLRHASAVLFADFNPDGKRLVTASDDNTASVWDISSGEMLVPPLRHDGTVLQAVFSPDGQRVATASPDQTARVWDADTGQILSPPLQHPWAVREVRFDSEGKHLLTTGATGATWSWDLPTTNAPTTELIRFAQLLSGSRIDEHRGIMPLKMSELNELWISMRQSQSDFFQASVAENVTHWHSQTAEECVRGRQWSAALWHFNALVEQAPDNWLYRARRGRAQAELGHWKEAIDDFAEVVRRAPEEVEVWCLLAILRLRLGDNAGFRRCCASLLEQQQAKANDPRIAYLAAWTCVLSAESDLNGERLVELAKQAVVQGPNDPDYLCTWGATLFRAGDGKSAEMRLNQAQAVHGLRPCVREWLWLSLVHERMGAPKEARRWLMKAKALLGSPDALPLTWIQRVELELLQQEAEKNLKDR